MPQGRLPTELWTIHITCTSIASFNSLLHFSFSDFNFWVWSMTPALVSLHWGGREWGWRDNSIVGNESHDTRLRETCTVYLQCNRIKDTSPLKNNQAWTGLVISIQLSSLSQAIHKLVRQAWSKLVRQACILRILLVSSLHSTTPTVDQACPCPF